MGRGKGVYGDIGSRILTDDGTHWIRRHDRNAVRFCGRAVRTHQPFFQYRSSSGQPVLVQIETTPNPPHVLRPTTATPTTALTEL